MMKKYYLLALLSCSCHLAWTQTQEKKAFALLDSISQHQNFRATFTYHVQADQEPSEGKMIGSITVQGPKYRLSLGGQEIVNNGTTLWNYLPEAKEVQINNYDPAQEPTTPWLLLTNYRQAYKFSYLHTHQLKDHVYEVVALLAKDKENTLQQMVLTINRSTHHIKRLEALDSNKTRHTFSVTKFETELPLDDAFFTFISENYADIEVIDMR